MRKLITAAWVLSALILLADASPASAQQLGSYTPGSGYYAGNGKYYGTWSDAVRHFPASSCAPDMHQGPGGHGASPRFYLPGFGHGNYGAYPNTAPEFAGGYRPADPSPSSEVNALSTPDQDPNSVVIKVSVPADAIVWVDGHQTHQTGALRQFVSPPMTPGQAYIYKIRVRWLQNGQEMDRTRHVSVSAGDRRTIHFMAPSPEEPGQSAAPRMERTGPAPAPSATYNK